MSCYLSCQTKIRKKQSSRNIEPQLNVNFSKRWKKAQYRSEMYCQIISCHHIFSHLLIRAPMDPHQCPPWPTFNWHVQVHLAAAALNPPSNPSPLSTPSSFAIALYQSYVQTWTISCNIAKMHQMAPRHIYHSSSIYSTTTKQSQIKDDSYKESEAQIKNPIHAHCISPTDPRRESQSMCAVTPSPSSPSPPSLKC